MFSLPKRKTLEMRVDCLGASHTNNQLASGFRPTFNAVLSSSKTDLTAGGQHAGAHAKDPQQPLRVAVVIVAHALH